MKRPRLAALLVLLVGLAGCAPAAGEAVLHREKSLYRDILVTEAGNLRCLTFGSRRAANRQSCIHTDAPDRLVLEYTRMMLAGLYLQPEPRRILVVGLGGGILPRALEQLVPGVEIHSVEIDAAVVKVAERWFHYRPSARVRTTVQDGRVYVKRALRAGTRYDLVFLDAYDHEYVPEHLLTREFLEEVRQVLAPGGIVVANTFATSRLYDSESVTWEAVYGRLLTLKDRNRIILAGRDGTPDAEALRAGAARWDPAFARHGVDSRWILARLSSGPDWDRGARVLTDRYSPSNLLNVPGRGAR